MHPSNETPSMPAALPFLQAPRYRKTGFLTDPGQLGWLSQALALSPEPVERAFERLMGKGLVTVVPAPEAGERREIAVALTAARRTADPVESAIVDFLLRTERVPGHPFVSRTPGVCGGAPVIRGTGVSVEAVANYFYAGKGILDVQRDYPHLSDEEILDALHFVLSHKKVATPVAPAGAESMEAAATETGGPNCVRNPGQSIDR